MSETWVLDASAVLAVLGGEPGADIVKAAIFDGATISSVNLCEVVGKLTEAGLSSDEVREVLDNLGLDVRDFDMRQALEAGILLGRTRALGLSLGDRACLSLALALGATDVTADHAWEKTWLPVKVRVVR